MTWTSIGEAAGRKAVCDVRGVEPPNNGGMGGYAWLNVDTGAVVALYATANWGTDGSYELWHAVGGQALRLGTCHFGAGVENADQAERKLLVDAARVVPPAAEEAGRQGLIDLG